MYGGMDEKMNGRTCIYTIGSDKTCHVAKKTFFIIFQNVIKQLMLYFLLLLYLILMNIHK